MKSQLIAIVLIQIAFVTSAIAQFEPTETETAFADAWLKQLTSDSSDTDKLIAIMFAQRHQSSGISELFALPMENAKNNKLQLSLMAYDCLLGKNESFCVDADFPNGFLAVDSDNAIPYFYAMIDAANFSNRNLALQALIEANKATDLEDYYFEKVDLVRKRLKGTTYPTNKINEAAVVLAGAARDYAIYAQVRSICERESKMSDRWKTQCLTLGRKLEHESRTAFQYVFGISIQLYCLGSSSIEQQEKDAVERRRQAFGDLRDQLAKHYDWWSDRSLKTDALYDDIMALGEVQTYQKAFSNLENAQ